MSQTLAPGNSGESLELMESEVTSHLLLGEIAGQPHSCRVSITASGGRASGFQIRISSPFAEKMELPLGVKAADRTSRLCGSRHRPTGFWEGMSQMRIVPSPPVEIKRLPSAENARDTTLPECPSK